MNKTLTIGQVARAASVRPDTVRYYEREGLIPQAARRPSGYRDFPEETVRRIRFIRRAQELGFTLQEIQELLELRAETKDQCPTVLDLARHKVEDINAKITDLEAMRDALETLMAACQRRRPGVSCPILEQLEQNGSGAPTARGDVS